MLAEPDYSEFLFCVLCSNNVLTYLCILFFVLGRRGEKLSHILPIVCIRLSTRVQWAQTGYVKNMTDMNMTRVNE